MKIWLNHTLACPDDASYPLQLLIYKWENSEPIETEDDKKTMSPDELFQTMIEGYESTRLSNLKDSESPLFIHLNPTSESTINKINIENMHTEKGIVRFKDDLLFDRIVITPIPLHSYLQKYKDILQEFRDISEKSGNHLAEDAYKLTTESILPIIEEKLHECRGYLKNKEVVEKFVKSIMQELLFLNFYLTYVEIEEGLLVCPQCKRWFPIIQTIPRIYPKFMKREQMDLDFKQKWHTLYPKDVVLD